MNRNEEYAALLTELDRTPEALEYTVERALNRKNTSRKKWRFFGIPAGSLAACFLGFMLLVNLFLLIVGMFIEGNAAMIILVPLLFPIAMNYGINEIQFLMMFIFNMAIGSMSPPMGTLMFVVCGETKCKLKDFIIESIPFYIVLIVELLALTFIPFLTTGLVDLIY